jgi:hypothetical protein
MVAGRHRQCEKAGYSIDRVTSVKVQFGTDTRTGTETGTGTDCLTGIDIA